MFRQQIDTLETGEPRYSESFDLLLDMAETSRRTDGQMVEDTAANISLEELSVGLQRFLDDVNKAVHYLRGEATLEPDPQDPGLIPEALQVLDSVIFLFLFLSSLEAENLKIPTGLREQIEQMYLQLTAMEDDLPFLPLHRLIPCNSQRLEAGQDIPENIRYHFPWYDLWIKLPDYTLERLCQHWQEIVVDNNLSLLEIPEAVTAELVQTIRNDSDFFQLLQEKSDLLVMSREVIAESSHLGLAILANSVSDEHQVADEVAEKGFQGVACKLVRKKLTSWQDKLERLLVAGLYGPDLDDGRRMEMFKEISFLLEVKSRFREGSLAQLLVQWQSNPLLGRNLLDQAMQHWQEELLAVAQSLTEPIEYQAGAFENAVTRLWQSEPVSLIDSLKEEIQNLIPTAAIQQGVEVMNALARTAFPPCRAFGHADSGSVECLQICYEEREPNDYRYLDVGKPEFRILHGHTLVEGELNVDNPPEGDSIKEISCRCLVDDRCITPLMFDYSHGRFRAGFGEEISDEKEPIIRLVMVI